MKKQLLEEIQRIKSLMVLKEDKEQKFYDEPVLSVIDEYFGGDVDSFIKYITQRGETDILWRYNTYSPNELAAEKSFGVERMRKNVIGRLKKEEEQAQLREDDEWTDFDEAHALFEYLQTEGELRDDVDVYTLYYVGHYVSNNLYQFDVGDKSWAICKEEHADDIAKEFVKDDIDSNGYTIFNRDFVSQFVDGDEIASYFEDGERENIESSPESYLDDDDKVLSDNQQDEINRLREEIEELKVKIEKTKSKIKKKELQEEIDEKYSEIEEIESEPEEWDEDAIDAAVERVLDEIRNDPVEWLKNMGYDEESVNDLLERFIDDDELAEAAVEEDGAGHFISSYDGEQNDYQYDGVFYSIFRIN